MNQACTSEVGTDATSTLTVYAKGVSAGEAAVTVTSSEDSTISASCTVTTEAAGTYSQESLQGAEHTLGEDKDAVYTITNSADDNRPYDRFSQVSVDGTVVASDYYTTAKGSLVLYPG